MQQQGIKEQAGASALTVRFTKGLKAASRDIHEASDALVNARLVGLFGSRQLYGRALACFYHVFSTIEDSLMEVWASHGGSGDDAAAAGGAKAIVAVRAAVAPAMRAQAFESDLAFYLGEGWRGEAAPLPAVQAYRAHLQGLAADNPLALLAHAYTQHMALLAGGQIIKKLARKGMLLGEDEGVAIYTFPGTVSELKNGYKQALDTLARAQLSEQEIEMLVKEHVAAFAFNNRIIREFPMGWRAGAGAVLRSVLRLTPPTVWLALAALLAALVTMRLLKA